MSALPAPTPRPAAPAAPADRSAAAPSTPALSVHLGDYLREQSASLTRPLAPVDLSAEEAERARLLPMVERDQATHQVLTVLKNIPFIDYAVRTYETVQATRSLGGAEDAASRMETVRERQLARTVEAVNAGLETVGDRLVRLHRHDVTMADVVDGHERRLTGLEQDVYGMGAPVADRTPLEQRVDTLAEGARARDAHMHAQAQMITDQGARIAQLEATTAALLERFAGHDEGLAAPAAPVPLADPAERDARGAIPVGVAWRLAAQIGRAHV